jgi:hypothetical protein
MKKANYEQNEDCDLLHALYAPLCYKENSTKKLQ